MEQLIKQKVEFHTFSETSAKTHAFVVRGLTSDITERQLANDLTKQYNLPVVNCFKMNFKNQSPSNAHKALFLLITKNTVILRGISEKIKYALHTRIYFERRRNTRRLTQCHIFQAWGHATANCHANPTCMFCAGKHETKTCTNKDQLNCANCGDKHQSNDIKCSSYTHKIKLLEDNHQTHTNKPTKTNQT